jgi:hypothetical protein
MSKIVGNCYNLLDWNDFIDQLESLNPKITKTGQPKNWVGITENDSNFQLTPEIETFVENTSQPLIQGNYNFDGVCWHVYRVNEHFNHSVVEKLSNFLNIVPHMSNAYRVDPGCNCPFHIDPQNNTLKNLDKMLRFTFQINQPASGQALIIEKEALSDMQPGDVYQWDDYCQWHAAANSGFESAYYFLIEGYPNES